LLAAAVAALRLTLVALGARNLPTGERSPLQLGLGAASLVGALVLALAARPGGASDPRLHLVRGRVVSIDPRAGEGECTVVIDTHRRLRVRPDGMVRHDPPLEPRLRLRVGAELAKELESHVGAGLVELAASTEGVALALTDERADS
jgi:hypothetical protein